MNNIFDKERIAKNFTPKNIIFGVIGIVAIIVIAILIEQGGGANGLPSSKYAVKASEAKQIKLVNYEGENFTMQIPEGWKVSAQGMEMAYAISVKDPEDERNQIFAVLKAAPFLKSQAAKNWHAWYVDITKNDMYKMFSEAVVLDTAKTESFYTNFNNYTTYISKFEPTYAGFTFPYISQFKNVEQFESNTYIKNMSLDDKTIRGTFVDSKNRAGEGLFMASIVNMGSVYAGSIDTSFYSAYNVMFISSAKDEFVNYKDILTQSLGSLQYKQSFVNATNASITERTDSALKANATVQAAFDSYNNAWTARQKTYDIASQKYSDATLGYARVYDKETGDIYKAYNGFLDDYNGERYQEVTDDMYTQSISGYIDKVR